MRQNVGFTVTGSLPIHFHFHFTDTQHLPVASKTDGWTDRHTDGVGMGQTNHPCVNNSIQHVLNVEY